MLALKRLEDLSQARFNSTQPENIHAADPKSATRSAPSKPSPVETIAISPRRTRQRDTSVFPWEFSPDELERFPALRKRNFFCMQRHQARALHYDLRLQLDGGTLSWALPRGLIGMSKDKEASHMAVQTTIHPISYSTHEVFSGGRRGGTLLWDIGEYEIGDSAPSPGGASSEDDRRRKRRRLEEGEEDDEDPLGRHEEDKLRDRFERPVVSGKQRTIRLILKNGRKMSNHSFLFILDIESPRSFTFGRNGREKRTWFVRLPTGIDAYPWDRLGEEGDFWGRSVKSELDSICIDRTKADDAAGRTFAEVCSSKPEAPVMFDSELVKYTGWSENKADGDWDEEIKLVEKISAQSARQKLPSKSRTTPRK